jgi:hypothetical protein
MSLDYNVFADDYQMIVGKAPPKTVTTFINRLKDDMEGGEDYDALYDEFPDSYTSIMDAMLMWEAGAAHAHKLLKGEKV